MQNQDPEPATPPAAAAWLAQLKLYDVTLEPDGVRTRTVGWLRFVPAAFFSVWLVGWCMGEYFALNMLLGLARDSELGRGLPRLVLHDPSTWFALLPMGFIAFWIVAWTAGGLLALFQTLHYVIGWDLARVTPAGLELTRGIGPITFRRTIPRQQITSLFQRPGGGALFAVTDQRKHRVLSLHGEQLLQARDHLSTLLGSTSYDFANLPGAVPKNWATSHDMDGTLLLEPVRRGRGPNALIRLGIAGFAGYGLHRVYQNAEFLGELAPLAAGFLAVVVVVFLLIAAVTTFRVKRYRVTHGRVALERGLGAWIRREEFAPPRLSIRYDLDSDGDEHCTLSVQAERRRHDLVAALNDTESVVQLARWLERETGAPLSLPRELRAA